MSPEAAPGCDGAHAARPRVEFNAAGVPESIRAMPNFVAWRLAPPLNDGDKRRKIPINPATNTAASSTDSRTWASFTLATQTCERNAHAGVGFMFSGSGLSGVDLDKCLDPVTGAIDPDAQAIIDRLQSYTEVSPSGTGVHIIVKGTLPSGGRRKGRVEMYDTARYFTLTGVAVPGTPPTIEDRQSELDSLHHDVFGTKSPRPKRVHGIDATLDHEAREERFSDDDELLDRALAAKNAPKFRALWRGDTQGYASSSEAVAALCFLLAFWTRDEAQIDRLFRRSGLATDKWDAKRGDTTWGQEEIRNALAMVKETAPAKRRRAGAELAPAAEATTAASARRSITVVAGKLPEAVDAADGVLAAMDPPVVFQRDEILVRIVRTRELGVAPGITRPVGAVLIHQLDQAYLVYLLTKSADWLRRNGRTNALIPTDAPDRVARTYMSSLGSWRVPLLLAVTETPTIRHDGTVLERPGYDSKSHLYFEASGVDFGSINADPTREDAQRSLEAFEPVLKDFPWREPSDRSVALAAFVTPLVRRTLRSAPMFVFRAPAMASGKSLLVDIVAMIATGRCAAVMTQGKDTDEMQKRILALLLAGETVSSIDNVELPLGGPDLCTALTQERYQGRMLGLSKMVTVPTCTTWCATGNNLQIAGDLVSRVLLCDIDPLTEAPGSRKFEIDLRTYVPEHRAELVRAGLTILLAYQRAGSPDLGLSVFGRFEDWSRCVRSPLVWLGLPDPLGTTNRLTDVDPVSRGLRELLHAWHDEFGDRPIPVAHVAARERRLDPGRLAQAIAEVLESRSEAWTPQGLGLYLRKYERRVKDGMCFERDGTTGGSARWRVRVVGGGLGGLGGPSIPTRESQRAEVPVGGQEGNARGVAEKVPQVPPVPLEPPLATRVEPMRDIGQQTTRARATDRGDGHD